MTRATDLPKTIRSSSKTKPDPIYYRDIQNRLIPKRNELLDAACAIEETNPKSREAKLIRLQADRLTAKIGWAIFQQKVAFNIVRQQREAVAR